MVSRFDFNNIDNEKRKGNKNINDNKASGSKKAKEGKSSPKAGSSKVNKKSESKNISHFKSKNTKSYKILLYVALIGVAAYLIFCFAKNINSKHISTYQVKEGSLTKQNTYTGLILREEKIYKCQSSGYYNYYLKEGEKASLTDLVYSIDGSGKIKEAMTNQGEEATTLTKEDLTEIQSEIVKFSKEFDANDYAYVYDFKDDLNSISLKMSNLYILDKITSLNMSGTTINKYYCGDSDDTSKAGYVVYYYDDYEDLKVEEINSSYFSEDKIKEYTTHMVANNTMVSTGDFAYKLVSSNDWKLIFPVTEELAAEFDGKEISVKFSKDQAILKGKVQIIDAVSPKKNTSIEKICVINFKTSVKDYLNNRYIDFEILRSDINGYKIPVSSITNKEFLLIPEQYCFDYNPQNSTVCIKLDKYLDDGTKTYITTELKVYDYKDGEFYVDGTIVHLNTVIYGEDETSSYSISKAGTLSGVYKINQGYADFKKIDQNYEMENDEYVIINPKTTTLKTYDYIALDASKIKDDEYIYE